MKSFTLTLVLAAFAYQAKAQCTATDSTLMGAGTANDVYFSLKNGTISTVSNTNWHLAFSVQSYTSPTNPAVSVAIRVNSAGNGTVVKRLDNANPANWRSIDTAGLTALPQQLDSDSTWNLSAFTAGYDFKGAIMDFKWGTYNQNTHHINGTKVFILQNADAGLAKKVFVKQLFYDSLWNVIISNIDNSDSVNITINKRHYPNRMFVYYNASTKQVMNREPAIGSWDLLWTRYVAAIKGPDGNLFYHVTGVLSNPKVLVEQNLGKKCNGVWLSTKTSKVDPSISAIGHNWKTATGPAYAVTDTFVYFIKGQDARMHKLSFLSFVRDTQAKTVMNIYEATTGIDEIRKIKMMVFPNPSHGIFHVNPEMQVNSVNVVDMLGRTVYSTDKGSTIDIAEMADGLYIIRVNTPEGVYHQRILKE
jgi:hypothetical protein